MLREKKKYYESIDSYLYMEVLIMANIEKV